MSKVAWAACIVAANMLAVSAAQAASAKEVFEKRSLLGTYAFDCSKPAGQANLYFVNRALDASRVQRDQMSSATARDAVTIIEEASEVKPNEIVLRGTRDGQPTELLWRLDGTRQLGVDVTLGGRKVIADGRLLSTGDASPWLNKCG